MSHVATGRRSDTSAAEVTEPAAADRPTRVPAPVWYLLVLHVTLLVLYTVLVPTFRAPDEYMHVDLALDVADGGGYPRFDQRPVAASIFQARDTSLAYLSYAPAVGVGAAAPRAERPAFEDLGPEATDILNQMPQHPPLYYGIAGGTLAALDSLWDASSWPFDRQVAALRLLDVLLVAPLPLLAWSTARRLGLAPVAAVAAATLVLCIPSLTHIGSVVNNDDLLVLLGGVLTLLVVRIMTGDTTWRTALLSGLVLGGALLTKGFALVLVPWLVTAYAVALAPARRWGELVSRTGAASAIAFVVGGWWWARNLLVDGVLLPAVNLRDRVPVDPDVGEFARGFLDRLLTSVWGSFGWQEAELSVVVVGALSALLAVAVALGLWRRPRRAASAVLLLPAVVLTLLIAANAWRAYLKTGVPYATQGRYLFAGLLGVLVVAAAAVHVLSLRMRPRSPLALLVLAVVLHAFAIDTITARYWTGGRIATLVAFSPWPAAVVAMMAVAVLVAAVAAARSLRPSALLSTDRWLEPAGR